MQPTKMATSITMDQPFQTRLPGTMINTQRRNLFIIMVAALMNTLVLTHGELHWDEIQDALGPKTNVVVHGYNSGASMNQNSITKTSKKSKGEHYIDLYETGASTGSTENPNIFNTVVDQRQSKGEAKTMKQAHSKGKSKTAEPKQNNADEVDLVDEVNNEVQLFFEQEGMKRSTGKKDKRKGDRDDVPSLSPTFDTFPSVDPSLLLTSTLAPSAVIRTVTVEVRKGKSGMGSKSAPIVTLTPTISAIPSAPPSVSLEPTASTMPTGYYPKKKGKGMSSKKGGKSGMKGDKSKTFPPSGGGKEKKSKGKGKGKGSRDKLTPEPTHPPATTIALSPTVQPSILDTLVPFSPMTSIPGSNTVSINMTMYQVRYIFDQVVIPSTSEVEAVTTITSSYLSSFFAPRFPELITLETENIDSRFVLMQPYEMNFTSSAIFPEDAMSIPPVAELDLVLMSAFTGNNQNVYIDLLSRLPASNVFSMTTEIMFDLAAVERSGVHDDFPLERKSGNNSKKSKTQESSGHRPNMVAIGTSAGAGAFVALILAAMHIRYRKRRARQGGVDGLEKGGEEFDDVAHLTVAGDTYRGGSTLYGGEDSTIATRRHTRFAKANHSDARSATRFSMDEDRSLATRSDWGMSTRAISEEGDSSSDDDGEAEITAAKNRLFDEENPILARDPLASFRETHANDDADIQDTMLPDDLSVDSFVPMRVVDLIKKFSPSYDGPWRTPADP